MKDEEGESQKIRSEMSEKENTDGKERTGKRRRTAREIAQMFEQLKQRHQTRKKEWHDEKQELLRQANLAEDSKRLLVELKRILGDLKEQLFSEEKKRKGVEADLENAKLEWKIEKERLLKIIANLESRSSGSLRPDRRLSEELESVKSRLLAREKELATIQKSNSEIRKSNQELHRKFEQEKRQIYENYEGEKRNWEKTRQVMLEKIETLQEELRSVRTDPFPLHGSHVASPFDDVISGMTSPDMGDIFPKETRKSSGAPLLELGSLSEHSTKDDRSYGDFQRTVDEALTQIEKITQDLQQVGARDQQPAQKEAKSFVKLSPLVSSNADSSQALSKTPAVGQDQKTAIRLGGEITSMPDHCDVSVLPRSKQYAKKSECNSKRNVDFPDSNVSSTKSLSHSKSTKSNNSKIRDLISKSTNDEIRDYIFHSKNSGLTLTSPDTSLSPSGSCSIPTFTESSGESPLIPQLSQISEDTFSKTSSSSRSAKNSQQLFAKVDVKSAKDAQKENKTKPKKLPGLHQQLLFGSAPHQKSFNNESYQDTKERTKQSSASYKKQQQDTQQNQEEKKIAFASGPKKMQNQKTLNKELSASVNFVDNISTKPQDEDFVEESNTLKPATSDTFGPPVWPKPSVTIEKDKRGNVLRVISDPRYKLQESPEAVNAMEEEKTRGRRRRSQEVIHDMESLIPEKTSTFPRQNQNKSPASGKTSSIKEKESIGSKGKSWIKKRLSFLDSPLKDESSKSSASPKKRDRSSSKSRSSSSRREGRILDVSTSEESDDVRNPVFSRSKSGKKDASDKKGKTKRYTRSKTDSSVDVRNLLSKFKASQFNSKKPSIVKEFEKKLLENEVKTLDENKNKRKEEKEASKKRESLRVTSKLRDKHDDGYSGEDELDFSTKKQSRTSPPAPALSVVRSPSIKSLQEHFSVPKTGTIPQFHESLSRLASPKEKPNSSKSGISLQTDESTYRQTYNPRSPHGSVQFVRTTFAQSPKLGQSLGADALTESDSLPTHFQRGSPGYLSLPDRSRPGFGSKKRLSWAADMQQSIDEETGTKSPDAPLSNKTDVDRINTSVAGIVLKPKQGTQKTSTQSRTTESISENIKAKNKSRMSEVMKKKALNLEKALKKGPTRVRRYKRSETQPIAWSPSSNESETDYEPSKGMVKAKSMSEETFTKKLHSDIAPDLTSLFKKPVMTNRRLPSRWQKKNSDS